MPNLPENQHDWANWLFEQLESIRHLDASWEGFLPERWDYEEITNLLPDPLKGVSNARARLIEFYPEAGDVFKSLNEMVSGPRRRTVPEIFTVRELQYTHGKTTPIPQEISNYMDTVHFWQLLKKAADHEAINKLYFIKAFDAKIEVLDDYAAGDLVPLTGLSGFATDYIESTHHQDQKRNIVRSALLEIFKGKRCIKLSEILPCFNSFMDSVRSSYAMYTADFSYEKIRTEVDKQNLEDTLRLNKTVSDIQNQLLALPAALLLAGAGIEQDKFLKNLAVWLGICIFAWMMRTLVSNQGHSIDAIQKEINLRKQKLKDQPEVISKRFSGTFDALIERVDEQVVVLRRIKRAVVVIWFVVTAMIVSVYLPKSIEVVSYNLNKPLTWASSSALDLWTTRFAPK